MSDSDFEDIDSSEEEVLPESIAQLVEDAKEKLMPAKSSARYEDVYNTFMKWIKEEKLKIDENTVLAYFSKLS